MTYRPSFEADTNLLSLHPDHGAFYGPSENEKLHRQDEYDFRYLVFPNDLGIEDNGHYMVININVPSNSDKTGILGSGFAGKGLYKVLPDKPNNLSKVDRLRFGQMDPSVLRGDFQNFKAEDAITSPPTFGRWTRRIAESIAIFMPSALVHNTQHAYENISLTALAGTVASAAVVGFGKGVGSRGTVATAIAGGIANADKVSRLAGRPINPMVEILFATTVQKEFIFEFLLAPRNYKESVAIKSIIKTLKFHAAPELTLKGFAFIPPAEFDITFFNKGTENTNIPRINTCVLERIEADYSPTGAYSTFSTGHPVAIRLSLGFRELEIGHKLRVAQGF